MADESVVLPQFAWRTPNEFEDCSELVNKKVIWEYGHHGWSNSALYESGTIMGIFPTPSKDVDALFWCLRVRKNEDDRSHHVAFLDFLNENDYFKPDQLIHICDYEKDVGEHVGIILEGPHKDAYGLLYYVVLVGDERQCLSASMLKEFEDNER